MTTPSRPLYPQLGRHATLGTPHRLEPQGLGSPQRVSPSRSSNTRVTIQAPPATPRAAISVNRMGSNRRARAAVASSSSSVSSASVQRLNSQINTLQEIMARDNSGGGGVTSSETSRGGYSMTRDMSRDSTMHDSTMSRAAPSSAFKFRSGMPLDMPMGGYRDGGDYEEDETITKRRRVASHVSNSSNGSSGSYGSSNSRSKNVTWEDPGGNDNNNNNSELSHMIQQLLVQNQRMEEKLSRFERLEEKLERMDRVESRLMRVESKMDEILRMCRR